MSNSSNQKIQPMTKSLTPSTKQFASLKPLALVPLDERRERLDQMLVTSTERIKPADKDRIGKMLAVVASMIGAPIPSPTVLSNYIQFLSEYPQDLIDIMGKHVIDTHRYNTFPRVADFVEPVKELLWARQRNLKDLRQTRIDYLGHE